MKRLIKYFLARQRRKRRNEEQLTVYTDGKIVRSFGGEHFLRSTFMPDRTIKGISISRGRKIW